MRSLPIPGTDPGVLYRACAAATSDNDLKSRLLSYLPRVAAATQSYELVAVVPEFHSLARSGATAIDEELRDLYKRTMIRKGGPGRTTYDQLRLSATLCPLCGQRDVSTLDHYLPKESYADFSILPINLVPACAGCNRIKHRFFPANSNEQLLHPYFDRLPSGIWLHASVNYQTDTPVLEFTAEAPATWSVELRTRVVGHFSRLELATLYSIHGTREIPMIRSRLQKLLESGGADAVRSHLQEEASTRQAEEANSWQAATYAALATEPRFWTGDFGQ